MNTLHFLCAAVRPVKVLGLPLESSGTCGTIDRGFADSFLSGMKELAGRLFVYLAAAGNTSPVGRRAMRRPQPVTAFFGVSALKPSKVRYLSSEYP